MAKRKETVNCQLPGAELLAEGKSVDEIMQSLDQKKRGPGRPRIFDTPEQMQAAIDDYFESCWGIIEITKGEGENRTTETRRVQERPYTIMGLALALNMCRETLCDYAKNGTFSDIVKRAKQTVELAVEEQLIAGKNATGPIFWLKNHAGYKDKTETELSGKVNIHNKHELTEEELIAIAAGRRN